MRFASCRVLPFVMLLLCVSCTQTKSEPPWQNFAATAYSVEGTTSSGKQTVEGRTVAADPRVLPAGTRIEVADAGAPYDGTYVVHDTGPAVKGAEIDIFINDPSEAKRFGRKQVRVRVLESPRQGQASK
jgi:3D (Asp-Asp-Asp) domain-containing protein